MIICYLVFQLSTEQACESHVLHIATDYPHVTYAQRLNTFKLSKTKTNVDMNVDWQLHIPLPCITISTQHIETSVIKQKSNFLSLKLQLIELKEETSPNALIKWEQWHTAQRTPSMNITWYRDIQVNHRTQCAEENRSYRTYIGRLISLHISHTNANVTRSRLVT